MARTPVRQALFKLQQEGYVEVLFRSDWRVLSFDFDQFEQLCDLHQVHLARQGVVGANTGLLVQQAGHFSHRRFQHRQYGGDSALRHAGLGGRHRYGGNRALRLVEDGQTDRPH